ncbi:MAG: SAM-dependent methyltransferase, partial [Vicinamibacterales bacterium]
MDITPFDRRGYRTVSAEDGYTEWAATYEETVLDLMDLRLLERIASVAWSEVQQAADLACGTGRIGQWLTERGVPLIDGIDLTAAMLDRARTHG